MATIQNTFIRKYGELAVIITVTDWKDYAELERHMKNPGEGADFLISSTTTKSMYSNMQPTMQMNLFDPIDITEGTKGMGLAGIITQGCDRPGENGEFEKFMGGIWSYRNAGLTYSEAESKPKIS